MNENEKNTSAPEPTVPASTVGESAATKSENELEAAEQPQVQPAGPAEHNSGPSIELVKADSLVHGDLPEPSAHVIREHVPGAAQVRKPEAGKEAPQPDRLPGGLEKTGKGLRDNSGRYFDPEKHQHRNGAPKVSEKGYFRPWGRIHRKAGLHLKPEGFAGHEDEAPEREESFFDKAKRFFTGDTEPDNQTQATKPETRESAPQQAPQSQSAPQFANGGLIGIPQPAQSAESGKTSGTEAATAAAQLVAMEEMIAVMIFSEEWQFLSEERKGLVMAWTRAFEEKGVVETPWWMELGAAHAVIFANRADKPKTREKLGKMKASIMKKVIDFRTAKAPAQVQQRKEAQ